VSVGLLGRKAHAIDVVGEVDQWRLRVHAERGGGEFRIHGVDQVDQRVLRMTRGE
jgi:hypothetical protein